MKTTARQSPAPDGRPAAPAQRQHDFLQLSRARPSRRTTAFLRDHPRQEGGLEFADHKHFKTVNQIQLLDVPGDPVKGKILR